MSIELLKSKLSESAKDIKLNLSTILTEEGAPDLAKNQIAGIALATAYATKNSSIVDAVISEFKDTLTESEVNGAKAATTIMAMNNVYYRFIHLVSDKSFSSMPAKLRMNVIANPGIEKINFELNCLAVSAINGCGMCVDAHVNELMKSGVSKIAIQSAVRIASVLNAAAMGVLLSV